MAETAKTIVTSRSAIRGKSWYTRNRAFHQAWFRRIRDLIESYRPDLLYSDGGLPSQMASPHASTFEIRFD